MKNPEHFSIRIATIGDAEALLAIYTPYVENTVITFEYQAPTVEEFRSRIENTLSRYPYLVAERDGEILGYAYASAFKSRAAYSWSVETSIYVSQHTRHAGIGTALYQTLEQYLSRQNICNLCACIAYPNPASVAFHEHFGYTKNAHFHQSGYKNGQWVDMIWMEKTLSPHTNPPLPFIPFPEIQNNHKEDTL
ncbi:MAG: N-acetyltransferase [Lachnospiraceae bacterium]|nr:N-acetyltransferase [Lachnospiraceae bacterium]